tara:strand:+ start:330 stop:998 length:669 start_codon:yes stop_codon:yes gene_type:complete
MAWMTAAAIAGSAYLSSQAAGDAADVQVGATEAMTREQRRQYDENVARQKPFYEAGVNALPELVNASRYTPFGMGQFQADPGYAFRLSEGQKALERSAAARGGLLSGGTGKALQRFGQEMGSQEYMNAFNRYQAENQAKLNPLQSLTGMGQTTANTLGQAGQQMASNVGEAIGSGAAARASGYVGQANALTSGLGTYLNYNQGQNMLATLNERNAMQDPWRA